MTPDSPSVGGDSSSRESSLIQIASRASTADRLSRQQSRQRRRASILKGTHTHFESRDEKDDNDDSLEDEDEDEDEDEESDEEGDGTRIDEEEDQTEPWFLNRPPSRNRRFTSLTQEESTGEDGERSYMAARSLPSRLGSPRSDESFSRTEASPSASKRKRDTWSTIDLSSATGNMHGAAPPPCKRRVLDKASGNSPRHAYRHGRKRRRQGEYLTPRTPVADQNGFGRDSPSQDWDYYSRRQSPLPSHDGYEGPRPASSDAVTDDANAPGFSLAPPIPPRLSLGFDPALISESLHKFLKDAESASKQPPERSLNNAAPSTSQAQRPLPPQPEKPSLVFDPPKTQPDALHHKPPPLPKNTTRRISKSRAFEPPEHAQAAGVSAPRCALSTSISAAPTPGAPAASHYAADPPSPRLSVKEEMLSASTQTDSTANLHRHAARPSTSPSDGSSRKPCVHHVHSPCSVCTCATSNLIVSLLHWAHSAEWFSCECEK
ncbi:hypothetical protein CC85DRAFT_289602 [Cutaneotrichosporon oleaginosum]|uniref:Uncharacterized protein n=1 Tax=Cutaneotrichosporon oleaginosum TaxID=879819 RepID=A0A0J0XBC3_9TREE|nr:uncharacterized protein CC85DRAFT_289602 [Cutaneotrichosporon oleaginosum]KLT38350.1 hypothetical protein CC85DRAFT_289602 [Cutaneotrichosporon oleaginosum]TXT10436.1 hypothetical protein COLE_04370 [Cutaneotrichosporon oleaginosum]